MRMTGCRWLQFAKFNSCQCNISWPLGFDHDIFKFIFDACMTIIASAHNYIIWVIAAVISIGKYQGGTFRSVFGPLSPKRGVLFFPLKSKFLSNFFTEQNYRIYFIKGLSMCSCGRCSNNLIGWTLLILIRFCFGSFDNIHFLAISWKEIEAA